MPKPSNALNPAVSGVYPESGGEVSPTAHTGGHSGVTTSNATLAGTVNPNGLDTYYYFRYGGDHYGYQWSDASAGAGTANVTVSQTLTGLTSARHYHYKLVAYSVVGSGEGSDRSFDTDYGRDDWRHHSPHEGGRSQ